MFVVNVKNVMEQQQQQFGFEALNVTGVFGHFGHQGIWNCKNVSQKFVDIYLSYNFVDWLFFNSAILMAKDNFFYIYKM